MGADGGRPPAARGETNQVGWLGKLPVVSLLIVGAMFIVPLGLVGALDTATADFDAAQEQARAYYSRNPKLVIDPLGELMIGPEWLAEAREVARASGASGGIELPARMRARTQGRLDAMIDEIYRARLESDPAWRFGVLDAQSPPRSYLTHAFVHETMAGVLLCVVVLLVAGAPLERAWGSLIFGGFALASIPLTAHSFRLLDGSSGVPWSGGAGLAAALLGAYFIRGLGGHFVLPGWVLLPAWLGIETFVVRGFWLDDLGGVPWASFIAAIGFGALAAGALRLMGVESRLDSIAESRKGRGPNPVVARAARLRTDGDPYQAFDLIQAAWRDDPEDSEIAEAFFSIAVEVGQPGAAAEAIVPRLRSALKSGDVELALEYWLPLATIECDVRLEATAAVRLGEALLDAGHPEEALFSLRSAIDSGVSPAHATRIVNIARDLDEGLARRAAHIALADPTLDPRSRADLEPIASPPTSMASVEIESPPSTPPPMDSSLDRRVAAEHHPVETTAFPLDADLDFDNDEDLAELDPHEASLIAQDLDAGALSLEHLTAAEPTDPDEEPGSEPAPGDVLSHWNDPSAIDDLSEDLSSDFSHTQVLSSADLESIDERLAVDLAGPDPIAAEPDLESTEGFDPRDAETDSDMTPMMDVTDEMTSPLAGPPAEEEVACGVESAAAAPAAAVASPPPPEIRRSLKAVDAVPVGAGEDWIEIDVDGRGKSKLPLARIQAISMAAVGGLGPRPVLVVDFVLSWNEGPETPLKVIRLRSDRFDPLRFEPAGDTPLDALTRWVAALQARSDAACLPSRDFLAGRFLRFESVEAYESEILMAVRGES